MVNVYDTRSWIMTVYGNRFMGVWPLKDRSTYDVAMRIIVYIFLYALIIPLGIRMVNEVGTNTAIVVENVVGEMYLNAAVIKYTMTLVNAKKHAYIYRLIKEDWENIRDEDELKIMKDYARVGRTVSLTYMILCSSATALFISMPMLEPLLDYVIPLENQTRPWVLPYYAEYYIDQTDYYIPLISQGLVSGLLSVTVFISYDMAYTMCVQHVCSLFDIISLRLRHATELANEATSKKDEEQTYHLIKQAIILHQVVIENVNSLEETYFLCWFFILLLNTTAIGGGFVIVLIKLKKPLELLRYGAVVLAIFIHKYYIFLPGQKIINYSVQVFDTSYACDWYKLSPRCKTLVKIMMARSIRPLNLTGGKMFILCMETYSSMLKAGMSYFTLMNNTSAY